MRTRTKAIVAVGGTIVGLNVLVAIVNGVSGGTPGGAASSSYATADAGLAAYASLLDRAGHGVTRLRKPLAESDLDPSDTVVLLDADGVTRDDAHALRNFVSAGGRLVVGGTNPSRWLEIAVPGAPEWQSSPARQARPVAPVPETEGVDRVVAGTTGSWTMDGPSLPALADGDRSLLSIVSRGPGRALLLADVRPLQNAHLAEADNARLGVALAGPSSRRVVFAESYHGYGAAAGIGAVPTSWKVTLGLLGLAAIVLMVARGRRFGPPEPDERELAPPRRVYVDSLATTLARRRDRADAAAALRMRARAILGRDNLDDDSVDLGLALERAGVERQAAHALVRLPADDDDLIAAGEVLAALERSSQGRVT